jgi:hypothetical protein
MMRSMVIGACALAALSCASGNAGNPPQSGPTDLGAVQGNRAIPSRAGSGQSMYTQGASNIYTSPDAAVVATIPASLDMAYAAIISGYSGIKIDVLTADSRSHVVGNSRVLATGSMLGKPLSKFFDCGKNGVTGVPRADDYHVTFSIVSTLSRVDSLTTRVSTLVTASAADPSTTGTEVHCVTTGALERTLLLTSGYPAK